MNKPYILGNPDISDNPDKTVKITYLGVTDHRILMEKIKKQNAVVQAARNFFEAIYASGGHCVETIKETKFYETLEQLELALAELDD